MNKTALITGITGLAMLFAVGCGVTEAQAPITETNVSTVSIETVEAVNNVIQELEAIEIPEAPVTVEEVVLEAPVEEVAPVVSEAPSAAVYEVYVGTYGHQAEIDACMGPVLSDYGTYGISIGQHNDCGGAYVLDIQPGDTIILSGVINGTYVAGWSQDVLQNGTDASVLGGGLWLQTCYWDNATMRLVSLEQVV